MVNLHFQHRWPAALGAIALAALAGGPAHAADSLGGLGSAFRPQALPAGATFSSPASGAGAAAAASGLRVVVKGPGRTLASIDGRLVRVGDVVNGMRVMQISEQGVALRGEDGSMERLSMNPAVVKKPSPTADARVTQGARP